MDWRGKTLGYRSSSCRSSSLVAPRNTRSNIFSYEYGACHNFLDGLVFLDGHPSVWCYFSSELKGTGQGVVSLGGSIYDRLVRSRELIAALASSAVGLQRPQLIEVFTRAIDLSPEAETYDSRGKTYSKVGDYASPMADFSRSIKVDPVTRSSQRLGDAAAKFERPWGTTKGPGRT